MKKQKAHKEKKTGSVFQKKIRKTKTQNRSVAGRLKSEIEKVAEHAQNLFKGRPFDIVDAIKMDHQALRNFLKVLKDPDSKMSERRNAYRLFSVLLKSHSLVEEQVVYATSLKLVGDEMHIKVTEGYAEHQLAKDLMKRIERSTKSIEWSAHANVLAEVVEHHLREEEKDLLPLIRKVSSAELDLEMVKKYMVRRKTTQKTIRPDNAGVLKNIIERRT